MPVQVERQDLEPCRVALTVTVDGEQVSQTLDSVFNQFAKHTTVPGFRRGKAPRNLARRFIDEGRVREEALDRLIQRSYQEALRQAEVEPYLSPSIDNVSELKEGEPLSFTTTVPLRPTIELGEYKGLTFRRLETPIGDDEVTRELERLADQSARYEDIDEAAGEGDRVLTDIEISIDGEVIAEAGAANAWLQLGANFPEFDAGLTGATAGEERNFAFHYPEDFAVEERRGKEAQARVNVHKVQRRLVPTVDDAFAESLGYDSLEDLQTKVREQLEQQATALAEQELNDSVIREVVRNATVNFPQEMSDREVATDMDELVGSLEQRGLNLQQYLEAQQMDMRQLEEQFTETARRRIANTLVLFEVARAEDIQVTDEDRDAELQRLAEANNTDLETLRAVLQEREEEQDRLDNRLLFRKVLDFLKAENTVETATA